MLSLRRAARGTSLPRGEILTLGADVAADHDEVIDAALATDGADRR
jgi:hypothetical protein